MTRIDATFERLKSENKKAFIAYIMAGDPTPEDSSALLAGLPEAGVDIIELGLPFTDPMADGETIQLAGQRALEAGMTLQKTLDMASEFAEAIIDDCAHGYYNPIYSYGVEAFLCRKSRGD